MAKSKKAKPSKVKPVKAAKPAKPAKAVKPKKVAKKVAAKAAAKPLKKADKPQKVQAKLPKQEKPETKKLEVKVTAAKPAKKTDVKDIAKSAKPEKTIAAKGAASKVAKKSKDEEEEPIDELDELDAEEIQSYGDAIRLTPEDLEDPEDIFLTDAEGRRYCKVKDCDQLAVVESYCRLHYLALWKKIQTRKKILADGKLEKYIEELTSRYPDKYIEMIRRDLKTEKDFLSAIQELEIDDSSEGEFEEDSSFIDEVRGVSSGGRRDESGGGEEF